MNQDIKNKIEKIISNQNADEREILSQLKQLIYETELKNSVVRSSKSITELISENIKQLQGKTHQINGVSSL
jgi:hypothetical protein